MPRHRRKPKDPLDCTSLMVEVMAVCDTTVDCGHSHSQPDSKNGGEKGLTEILLDAAQAGKRPPDFALRGADDFIPSDSDSADEEGPVHVNDIVPPPDPELEFEPAYREEIDPETGTACLVAARDLKAGEVLVEGEAPLMTSVRSWTPQQNPSISARHCLTCCRYVNSKNNKRYTCQKCKWPVCDPACEMASIHADNECPILTFCAKGICDGPIRIITILRLCLTKIKKPKQFASLMKMKSVRQQRKADPRCAEEDFLVWEFINGRCKLDLITFEEMIHLNSVVDLHAIWLLTINDPQLKRPINLSGQGLWETFGLLEKSCIPNVTQHVSPAPNRCMTLTVAVPISRGTKLRAVWGPFARNSNVGLKSFFHRQSELEQVCLTNCSCSLCSDPTELGTYLSAVRCSRVMDPRKKKRVTCQGWLLPLSPLDYKKTNYACEECHTEVTTEERDKLLEDINKEFESLDWVDSSRIHDFVQNHRDVLHPGNMLITCASARWIYCRYNMLSDMPRTKQAAQDLSLFIKYGDHVLKTLEVLRPGISPERCWNMIQFGRAKLLRLVYDWNRNVYTVPQMKAKLQEAKAFHKIAHEMWHVFDKTFNLTPDDGMADMLIHSEHEIECLTKLVTSMGKGKQKQKDTLTFVRH